MQPIYNKLQEDGGFESIKRAFGVIEATIEAKENMTAEENQVLKIVTKLEKTDNGLYKAFKEKIKDGNPFTEESFVNGLSTTEGNVDKEREALLVHIAVSKMKHEGDDLKKISKIVDDTLKFTKITLFSLFQVTKDCFICLNMMFFLNNSKQQTYQKEITK